MKTTLKEENNELVMYFDGRLDTAASPVVEKDIQPLLESDNKNIVLDCTKLEYISSSGLRLFLSVLKNAKAKGNHVYITGVSNDIRNVFAMTGFINLFEFK
jgi:anti-sigma B factor antagonist